MVTMVYRMKPDAAWVLHGRFESIQAAEVAQAELMAGGAVTVRIIPVAEAWRIGF